MMFESIEINFNWEFYEQKLCFYLNLLSSINIHNLSLDPSIVSICLFVPCFVILVNCPVDFLVTWFIFTWVFIHQIIHLIPKHTYLIHQFFKLKMRQRLIPIVAFICAIRTHEGLLEQQYSILRHHGLNLP